ATRSCARSTASRPRSPPSASTSSSGGSAPSSATGPRGAACWSLCRATGTGWSRARRNPPDNISTAMAYVITQPCVSIKDASCVEVCPVDCIHSDDAADMYFIDPDECIDCGACVDPCPVDAIFPEDEVPEEWRNFIQINADYFKK